jgi:predicted secreted protein
MRSRHLALAFSGLVILKLTVSQPQGAGDVTVRDVNLGDSFAWHLPAQLGSGRRWLLREAPSCCVHLTREDTETSGRQLDGSEQLQVIYFEAYQRGSVELIFEYKRAFIPAEPPLAIAVLKVIVR